MDRGHQGQLDGAPLAGGAGAGARQRAVRGCVAGAGGRAEHVRRTQRRPCEAAPVFPVSLQRSLPGPSLEDVADSLRKPSGKLKRRHPVCGDVGNDLTPTAHLSSK